ncbi:MAG: short-chain dehydrogenase [Gemmatimonadota bacterium]|nr:short-chain dehydrogenase [Gemmatimonadota bacterium]
MDVQGKTILILGGSGLVGGAVARRLLDFQPKKLVLVALYQHEVEETKAELEGQRGSCEIEIAWGNIFLPKSVSKKSRAEMLDSPEMRAAVIEDLLGQLSQETLDRSFLFQLFMDHRPDAVVDCINTATAFAYQDVFQSAQGLLEAAKSGEISSEIVERHVMTLTMPQLIRHVQIVVEGTKAVGTQAYVKIGTSGTGGMGLNVPYTHSEEKPSRMLLTKAATAGAHSLMLFLLARTPGAPTAVEIKPTAAIAWRKIAFGPIKRGGRVFDKFDCPAPVDFDEAFQDGASPWKDLGIPVESVFIDVGENGVFAKDEFETVSWLKQMEFITAEEVADYAVLELMGRSTGKNIIAALDSSTAGPTYRAGVLRNTALEELGKLEEEHGVRSVAFEMLGPPRLTKMLYEAHILSRLVDSIEKLAGSDPADLAKRAEALIADDGELRSTMISVGLPILVDGPKVYRAPLVMVPPEKGVDLDRVSERGMVDVRRSRCATWIERAATMVKQAMDSSRGTGSVSDWFQAEASDPIVPAQFATWVFRNEDDGERFKR